MNNPLIKQQSPAIEHKYVFSSEGDTVPRNVNQVKISKMTAIPDKALYRCQHLVEAEIEEGIEKIGDAAFSWCSALVNLSIPGTVATT